MKTILATAGSIVGWLGVIICLYSGLAKLVGSDFIFSHEAMTLFIVGIGLISTGCLAKLEAAAC